MKKETSEISVIPKRRSFFEKKGLWLNIVLFIVTLVSIFYVGLSLSFNYMYYDVIVEGTHSLQEFHLFDNSEIIFLSFFYSIVLILILLGHELGHYLTCRYYRIDATLPYFIPAPTLIGTLGAFIKIKAPITKKKELFDIGAAGPIVGFILSIPALVYGISLSRIVAASPQNGSFTLGEPLLFKLLGELIFGNVSADSAMILHPVAFAGWVGILITSFNLFPVGQLDGGHIFYALVGSKSRYFARLFLLIFVVMGIFFWVGWFVWALLISFLGLKHPRVYDEDQSLSSKRKIIGCLMVLIFILSFIPAPIKGYNLFDLISMFIG